MKFLKKLFPHPSDIVERPALPDHDGVLRISRAGAGFWRKECMVCRHALVNGTPEDSYETIQDLTTSPFEEFSTVPDGSFVRKVRCDGGKVYDGLRECPECGAILIEQKPTDRGNGNGDDR